MAELIGRLETDTGNFLLFISPNKEAINVRLKECERRSGEEGPPIVSVIVLFFA
ncbi:Asperfuranone polyketide synthase afoG [Clarias magur]|uniref:Asperfuranone polyketide synthase afoG n=1 Tax=Clarias magur TaxID=1594786 RepID=A0A8J4WYW3_CLAMG|nr:Asperfuranone polyketide synthase afoG [Clarias magur]